SHLRHHPAVRDQQVAPRERVAGRPSVPPLPPPEDRPFGVADRDAPSLAARDAPWQGLGQEEPPSRQEMQMPYDGWGLDLQARPPAAAHQPYSADLDLTSSGVSPRH